MHILFVHSHKFVKSKDAYYTKGQLPYELFKNRYLKNFEKVTVCARVVDNVSIKNLNRSDGKNVVIKKLPDLSVIKKRKTKIKSTKNILRKEIEKADILVARMPSINAHLAIKIALKNNKPFVVEVVGDVFESLWNHGSLIGKLIAPFKDLQYKKSIKKSKYTIYVTEKKLQQRYPSKKNAYTINASNVELEATPYSVLNERIKREKNKKSNILKIGLIGSFASKYKGIQNGIDLISLLNKQNISAELHILGDGDNRWLIERAEKLEVSNNIYFHGLLPTGPLVLEWLDKLDLYIQPSLTEGLPRALIEAMSRGLPAVGSKVGGIPELLEKDYLSIPGNSEDLFNKVLNLTQNDKLMIEQSEMNFKKAKEYSSEVLRERRDKYWKNIIKKEF